MPKATHCPAPLTSTSSLPDSLSLPPCLSGTEGSGAPGTLKAELTWGWHRASPASLSHPGWVQKAAKPNLRNATAEENKAPLASSFAGDGGGFVPGRRGRETWPAFKSPLQISTWPAAPSGQCLHSQQKSRAFRPARTVCSLKVEERGHRVGGAGLDTTLCQGGLEEERGAGFQCPRFMRPGRAGNLLNQISAEIWS